MRPAYQAPQNYGKGEDNRTGAFEEGFYPVPQAGHDVFEVGRAESRQLHQERELLHVAFHTRQAFHDIRCQGGRQDAYEIEDEQRQSLQVENPAYGAIRNDGLLSELSTRYKTISIVGMAKNVGKTTALNYLIEEAEDESIRLGITSTGRDGETTDLVTNTDKPRV